MSMNGERDKIFPRFRIAALIVGLLFFAAWYQVYKSDAALKSIPCEAVTSQYRETAEITHRLEEYFRALFIIFLTIAVEGIGLAFFSLPDLISSLRVDRLFDRQPKVKSERSKLPTLLVSDIDACITPNLREAVSLRNIVKLRQYCNYVRENKGFPPLILVSARAQEYTELLCQTLGIINKDEDVPCVLENGMALYYPYKRTVEILIADEKKKMMSDLREHLLSQLRNEYEFEPKDYMITINVERDREKHQNSADPLKARKDAIIELRSRIEKIIKDSNGTFDWKEFDVTVTDNAVDIVVAGVTKWTGLQKVMEKSNRPDSDRIAAIGNSEADSTVLREVGEAFCSEDAPPTIRVLVEDREKENLIKARDSAAVVIMIERVTGIRLT